MRHPSALVIAIIAASMAGCAGPGGPSTSSSTSPSIPADAVRVAAEGLAFEPSVVRAPAGRAFVLVFENREAKQHNIHVRDAAGASIMAGEVFTGPAVRVRDVAALAPGTYGLGCDIHPEMRGQLVAAASSASSLGMTWSPPRG